jgi:hypothetical protein
MRSPPARTVRLAATGRQRGAHRDHHAAGFERMIGAEAAVPYGLLDLVVDQPPAAGRSAAGWPGSRLRISAAPTKPSSRRLV